MFTIVFSEAIDAPNIKIHFLPLNSLIEMHKKSKYQRLFNSVYMSNRYVFTRMPEFKTLCCWGFALVRKHNIGTVPICFNPEIYIVFQRIL